MKATSLLAVTVGALLTISANSQIKNVSIVVNGQAIAYKGPGPMIFDGVIMLPLRPIVESSSGTVHWRADMQAAYVRWLGKESMVKVHDPVVVYAEGSPYYQGDVVVYQGRTFVPFDYFESVFGMAVEWINGDAAVRITTNEDVDLAAPPTAAPPKTAPPAATAQRPALSALDMQAKPWLMAGDSFTVEASGEPGCTVTVRIIGLEGQFTLAEQERGRYTGSIKVPAEPAVYLPEAKLEASISGKGGTATRTSERTIAIDTKPPAVIRVAPDPDAVVPAADLVVTATLADEGSGLDSGNWRLMVNSQDRSAEAKFENGKVTWTPAFGDIKENMALSLEVRDVAGNLGYRAWTFRVKQ